MEEIDLKELFGYFLKRIWVVLLFVVITLSIGTVYSLCIKTPMYNSTTSVILATDNNSTNTITQTDININQNLVNTYTEVIKSKKVLKKAINELSLDYKYDDLVKNISVSALDNTEIINITVSDEDSKTAKMLANSIAFIFEGEVRDIYNMKNVSILDKAEVATSPYNCNIIKETLIYIVAGLLLGFISLFLRYYFDRNIKSIQEVETKTNLPIMGSIRDCASEVKKNDFGDKLLIKELPRSNFAEDIKTIRTNLDFAAMGNDVKKILVTSSIPGEGKSFVSSNLAASFAQNNKKVILIDCDLRKGVLHKRLNLKGIGLSNLIVKNDISNLDSYINKTEVEGLDVITRGIIPPNPSELLTSQTFKTLLKTLEYQYDYIILDGTPVTNLPDSLIVSSVADKTLIVSSIDYTPAELLLNTKRSLENVNANIAGVIVNRVPVKKGGYYYSSYKYEQL